jgi:hypothetical protein
MQPETIKRGYLLLVAKSRCPDCNSDDWQWASEDEYPTDGWWAGGGRYEETGTARCRGCGEYYEAGATYQHRMLTAAELDDWWNVQQVGPAKAGHPASSG